MGASSRGAYSRGGLIKVRAPQVYQRQYLISFLNKNNLINVNRGGIKEEKVVRETCSRQILTRISRPIAEFSIVVAFNLYYSKRR